MTLQGVLSMSIPEYAGWARYACENPPGDVRTQALLAGLLAMVANLGKGKKDKPAGPLDFAPWLKPRDPKRAAAMEGFQAEIEQRKAAFRKQFGVK